MMFPHKVSVFNVLHTEDDDIVTKTLLTGVLFVKGEGTTRSKLGLADEDTVKVYIPKTVKSGSSSYIDPFDYRELSETVLSKFYTFSKGDYISFGDVDLNGVSVNDFKNQYGNLYEITGVSDYNYGGLRHFEITAK